MDPNKPKPPQPPQPQPEPDGGDTNVFTEDGEDDQAG